MSTRLQSQTTNAFFIQSGISFAVSVGFMLVGVACLRTGAWVRGFLALGLLYCVTSTFTLAKCVRDRQEAEAITGRVDQARLDKLLAEHDVFKVTP
jgi:hypothetical protein